jgi:general secretion pathway protein A
MTDNMSTNADAIQLPAGPATAPMPDERRVQGRESRPAGLRPQLLYERYGILENPFGVTPNPRYLYHSKTHAEARSSLIIGIECGVGFQVLIAPPGMGKTTLLFSILELFKDVARTAFLFQIHGDSRDLLRYLALELGAQTNDSDVVRTQDAINQLLRRERRAGRRTVIIIDEAQGLDASVLETIRLLSNFESPTEKLAHIILAGQPQLAHKLADPGLAQLSQRISIRSKLTPFGLEDTNKYIDHRLKIAGYQGPALFIPEAVKFIWERSRGIPREINTLCFNAMLLAAAVEQKQVGSDILQEVAADLDLDPSRASKNTAVRGMQASRIADELRYTRTEVLTALASITEICEALSRPLEQNSKATSFSARPYQTD